MSIIAEVLDAYGCYSAALERAYIQSQQIRQPVHPAPQRITNPNGRPASEPGASVRAQVMTLMADLRWRTVPEIAFALGVDHKRVSAAVSSLRGEGRLLRVPDAGARSKRYRRMP